MLRSIITGSGCYIPEIVVKNIDFSENEFYSPDGSRLDRPVAEIVTKFSKITGIAERRYAHPDLLTSDIAAKAGELAIIDSGIDREEIDQLIVAHNFGDMTTHRADERDFSHPAQTDIVPSLASRVKRQLRIVNPACIPYDLIFGCPGWLQGMIQADAFFKAGIAKNALIIGAEILSRVIDPHDRDSMIFSDGAGACILQYKETEEPGAGILSSNTRSDCGEETGYIRLGETYKPATGQDPKCQDTKYIKMLGRKVYEYALRHVPSAMKDCLDRSGFGIRDVKAVFIHQANEKMDEAIVKAFFGLYGVTDLPADVMPMCIQWLGNSSVATIPTLFDLVRKGNMPGHKLCKGDIILFASVGAGMNINAVCYGCC
ncbi:MAG: ketoacyl-ACP synthase III [Puia sp.]|nr:ketoacyl-ACP synthase III [Puia sp.]